jgi:hypothetical protein
MQARSEKARTQEELAEARAHVNELERKLRTGGGGLSQTAMP